MIKQLIVVADMEGASGIFYRNREALLHEELYPQYNLWRTYGRACITSDVLAVCQAAEDFGIDEIMLYDMHFAGCAEFNIQIEKLPDRVKLFDVPNREMHISRIRGQAAWEPFGIITVGQHARYGEADAYFAHTIHTPPIEAFYINGLHVAEIGQSVMAFHGVPYIANIGCAASHKEAREAAEKVSCITVKDRSIGWEPSPMETYPIIYEGVLHALQDHHNKSAYHFDKDMPVECELHLSKDYFFESPEQFAWAGHFEKHRAVWRTVDIDSALTLFWHVHKYIRKQG